MRSSKISHHQIVEVAERVKGDPYAFKYTFKKVEVLIENPVLLRWNEEVQHLDYEQKQLECALRLNNRLKRVQSPPQSDSNEGGKEDAVVPDPKIQIVNVTPNHHLHAATDAGELCAEDESELTDSEIAEGKDSDPILHLRPPRCAEHMFKHYL